MSETTRLAPSPTGSLHLGNARTFLVNWLLARQNNWRVILRIEDLDGPRIKSGSDRSAIEDLHWLGLNWDEGPIYQTHRMKRYRKIIQQLIDSGQAYPCVCSRRDIESAASAPHGSDHSMIYPGTCRDLFKDIDEARAVIGREPAIRFRVPDGEIKFDDRFAGRQSFDSQRDLGDFVIAKADGTPSYQLAVTVDDREMNVTQVVRGDDLLQSTAKQLLLMNAVAPTDLPPTYSHLPLIVGRDGLRLAKRHGDSRISYFRSRGVSSTAIIALIARWCGCAEAASPVDAASLIEQFDPAKVPRHSITFTAEDELSLLNTSA